MVLLAGLLPLAACQRSPEPPEPPRTESPQSPPASMTPPVEGAGTRSADDPASAVSNSYSGAVPDEGSVNAPGNDPLPAGDASPRDELPPPPPQ